MKKDAAAAYETERIYQITQCHVQEYGDLTLAAATI
jgi:hypothetical protein